MSDSTRTLGQHIASRLLEVGVDTLFAVPGVRNSEIIKAFPRLDHL